MGINAVNVRRRVTTVHLLVSHTVGPHIILPRAHLLSFRDLTVDPQVFWPFIINTQAYCIRVEEACKAVFEPHMQVSSEPAGLLEASIT